MSGEFHSSSQHEYSKLHSLKPSTIVGFAERTNDQALLEKFLFIMAERALAEEFNLDADNAAIFIHHKLESLRHADSENVQQMEKNVEELVDIDYSQEREFCEVFPYYFQDDDPQVAQLEREHEALFKQS